MISLPSAARLLIAATFPWFHFAAAQSPLVIDLWPGGPPGEKEGQLEERDTTKPGDPQIAGKPVIRLGNVSRPTITIHRPPSPPPLATAVVVCPGGGYHILALDLEGTEVCQWLNSIGVTAVLLKYRVPRREGLEKHAAPLQDAQRAFGLVRHRAGEFGIDPARLGVLGFSAGAHLAAALSAAGPQRKYSQVDAADDQPCHPDFAALIYPGLLTLKEKNDEIAPEVAVGAKTPPSFLVITQDDNVRAENAVFYALGLKKAGVPVELHLYPSGGHGYGLRRTEQTVTTWPDRATEWMRSRGLLRK